MAGTFECGNEHSGSMVGKPEGRRPLMRHRRRWEDNIKTDLQGSEIWGYGLDGAGLG